MAPYSFETEASKQVYSPKQYYDSINTRC